MNLLLRISPVLALLALGVLLRRRGWAGPRLADRFLGIVIRVALPAIVLATVPALTLDAGTVGVPTAAVFILSGGGVLGAALGRRGPPTERGVFRLGVMTMNTGFQYPFVLAAWGAEGLARFTLFDIANAVLTLTVVYAVAAAHGSGRGGLGRTLRRVAGFPPAIAVGAALVMNRLGVALPEVATRVLIVVGGTLVLLVPLALGIHLRWVRRPEPRSLQVAGLRLAGGLGFALTAVEVLGLSGLNRALVLFAGVAPVGFNTLVFASRERLDTEFASGAVSLSLLASLLYLPLWIRVLA